MESYIQLSFRFCMFIFVVTGSLSFNMDTKYPIVINNNADGPQSYFGASLALIKEDTSSAVTWIIIGSPRANSTSRFLQGVHEPGQLWRCSVGLSSEKCEIVDMDPKNLNQADLVDRKDGGWLGGAITSHGKRFVTCASRWSNRNANQRNDSYHYFMNGQCYWRPKSDLMKTQIPESVQDHYRLHALGNRNKQAQEDEFYWIFGQAGFSAHISESDELIIGAPGIHKWRGGFVRFFDSQNGSLSRNGENNDYSTFFKRNFVSKPEIDKLDDEESTYFGYAVTSGKFVTNAGSDTRAQYVGGGPRGNSLAGRVVIFQFPNEETRDEKLQIIQTIDGEQIGSYFGSVLLAVDINNDGYDDLLISAPYYNTKRKLRDAMFGNLVVGDPLERTDSQLNNREGSTSSEAENFVDVDVDVEFIETTVTESEKFTSTGFIGDGDEGTVFLYMSDGTSLVITTKIVGENVPWSHFGSALVSIGDTNKDGFNDIAVASPYEDQQHGSVYIFLGSSTGLQQEYAQVIKAKDIDLNLRGFGYSLASGVDIDKNGYNDLAIGAYSSNQVVFLRARPVIKTVTEIKASLDKLPINATEFEFQSCISYSGFNSPPVSNFRVTIRMDAKAISPRAHVKISEQSSNSTFSYIVKTSQNYVSCSNFTGVIKTHLSVTGKPIVIEQGIQLLESQQQLPFSRTYDVTRIGTAYGLHVSGPELRAFCNTCPELATSKEPFFFKLPLAISCNLVDHCISNLTVKASFLGIEEGKSFIVGSATSITLRILVENWGDHAFSPILEISWRKRNLVRIPPNCQRNNNVNVMSYECSLGHVLESNKTAEVEFEIDMREIYVGSPAFENEVLFDIKVDTSSELVDPTSTFLPMVLSLMADTEIWINGSSTDVRYNPTGDAVAAREFATFHVYLKGFTAVSEVWLNIEIPLGLTIGSQKMQLLQLNSYQAAVGRRPLLCTTDFGMLALNNSDTQNNVADDTSQDVELLEASFIRNPKRNLRKRDVDSIIPTYSHHHTNKKPPPSSNNRNVLSLDCSKSFVECLKMHCKVDNFEVGVEAVVELTMTSTPGILNSVFKKQRVQSIHVHSYAFARIIGVDSSVLPNDHISNEIYVTTAIQPLVTDVPTWVYMVSIVGGLLLLAAIVLCCYSLGYFERKRKKDNNETMKEDNEKKRHNDHVDGYDEFEEEPHEGVPLRDKGMPEENEDDIEQTDGTEQVKENPNFNRR